MATSKASVILPLAIILLGVGCWVGGNLLNDKQGGTNIALTLIGIGGGLAKQSDSTVKADNIEQIDIDETKS